MSSLLEKAKQTDTRLKIKSDEEIELFLAWCKGEINFSQVKMALGAKEPNSVYRLLALCARQYIANGKINANNE